MTDTEVDNVEQALADYPELQQELDFLDSLRKQLQSQSGSISSPGELGLKRLQRQLKKTKPSKSVHGWRVAAIAASVLLLVQMLVTLQMDEPETYHPASGMQDVGVSGTRITVAFAPEATEAQIRAVLLQANSRIIDGPSALGIYQLIIQGEPDEVIVWLKAQAVIESLQEE
ncbi:hypothetical protein LH51_17215 [Nitrincola sp. A-D6]|uniref:hypothetical protein n=1 Tax=Nitrincola sp. A-D6 TaxID=1545442 RepID=UPI00051FE544|nr:hypothetical protein [Nitrincola sp. A-D6]KGK41125.1 hypothetical protein LH51_17215 [Nitrincola sp. A-D6]